MNLNKHSLWYQTITASAWIFIACGIVWPVVLLVGFLILACVALSYALDFEDYDIMGRRADKRNRITWQDWAFVPVEFILRFVCVLFGVVVIDPLRVLHRGIEWFLSKVTP